jgi:large subunit ribosomal protein L31e
MAEKELERLYTIPLRGEALKSPRVKRANRAVKTIQSFLQRHMKSDTVKVSQKVNEAVWLRGIHKPPQKIKLKARKEEGIVYAMLPDETFEVKKKEEKPKSAEGAPKSALQKKAEEISEKLKKEKEAKASKPAETGEPKEEPAEKSEQTKKEEKKTEEK